MPYTLLLGGVRSGKSSLAVGLARSSGLPVTMLATGEGRDTEMAARIEAHRRERPPEWNTVEEPLSLASALPRGSDDRFVILDCLTLWVSNAMEAGWVDGEVEAEASAAAARVGAGVVVSNEVGWGIVPADPATRRYSELLGRVNQLFAATAQRVLLVIAGRVVELGGAPA